LLVDIQTGEGEQGRMDFDFQARDGADVQMGDAHGSELAVDRFDGQAEGAQAALLGARVRGHVVLVQRHEHTAAGRADHGLVGGAVVALVAVDPRPLRQIDRQFVDGREVVQAAGQQGEGHGQAVRRADQVQAPAEELLVLGGAVAAVLPPAHRPAAPRAHALADRDGHAVDDEVADRRLPVGEQVAQHVEQQGQPVGQRVQAPREARGRERARQIACRVQHGERAGVVVAEEGCRRHRDGEHLRVGDPREGMARMPQRPHCVVNHHVDPYNVFSGHRPSPLSMLSFNDSEADFDDDR